MIHLNFWSGFKANERCCLCKEYEEGNGHIINNCTILRDVITTFQIHDKFNDAKKDSFWNNQRTSVQFYPLPH